MARTIGDAEAGEAVTAEPEASPGCFAHPPLRAAGSSGTLAAPPSPDSRLPRAVRCATCRPQVCQVTLPLTGARMIIGSDGLWDAVHPKTAGAPPADAVCRVCCCCYIWAGLACAAPILCLRPCASHPAAHHTREMPAAEAAHKLLALAIKADKLKDDVTGAPRPAAPAASAAPAAPAVPCGARAGRRQPVILADTCPNWWPLLPPPAVVIVDFLPSLHDRLPPGFAIQRAQLAAAGKKGAHAGAEVAHLAHVWHPLREAAEFTAAGAEREWRALAGSLHICRVGPALAAGRGRSPRCCCARRPPCCRPARGAGGAAAAGGGGGGRGSGRAGAPAGFVHSSAKEGGARGLHHRCLLRACRLRRAQAAVGGTGWWEQAGVR